MLPKSLFCNGGNVISNLCRTKQNLANSFAKEALDTNLFPSKSINTHLWIAAQGTFHYSGEFILFKTEHKILFYFFNSSSNQTTLQPSFAPHSNDCPPPRYTKSIQVTFINMQRMYLAVFFFFSNSIGYWRFLVKHRIIGLSPYRIC